MPNPTAYKAAVDNNLAGAQADLAHLLDIVSQLHGAIDAAIITEHGATEEVEMLRATVQAMIDDATATFDRLNHKTQELRDLDVDDGSVQPMPDRGGNQISEEPVLVSSRSGADLGEIQRRAEETRPEDYPAEVHLRRAAPDAGFTPIPERPVEASPGHREP